MQVWRFNVLKNVNATRDIISHRMQEGLMAAQGLTGAEIIDVFGSESHGTAVIPPQNPDTASAVGVERITRLPGV